MSSQLTIREDQTEFTPDQMTALESLGVQQAMPAEVAMFFDQCQRTGLSPWARQIYMIGRWDSRLRRNKYQVQVSIDGLRLVAERTKEYQGQTAPEWCGPDGQWRDVWLEQQPPAAARVGVWRENFREPTYGVARLAGYMPKKRDGAPSGLWATMPDVMIAKVAEALALRKAFPMELSGLYTGDEMQQADQPRQDGQARQATPGDDQPSRERSQPEPSEDGIVDAEIVDDAEAHDEVRQSWVDAIHAAGDRVELMRVWDDARAKGAHTLPGLRDVFAQRGRDLQEAAA